MAEYKNLIESVQKRDKGLKDKLEFTLIIMLNNHQFKIFMQDDV